MSTWTSNPDGEFEFERSGYTLVVGNDTREGWDTDATEGEWWAWACWGYGPTIYDAEIGTGLPTRAEAMDLAERWLAEIEREERIAYESELRLHEAMEGSKQ